MIKLTDITKYYRTEEIETQALSALSFEAKQGEFLSIMGPSGCGKSTLLNLIGLLDRPDSGIYTFNGERVDNLGERQRAEIRKQNIGFIFQNFNLIDELSVYENIELPLIYHKISVADRKQKIHAAMERMNIQHRMNHFPQQLSGGQQQRVAIARAVAASPRLILADEPTGNLDSANGKEVMTLLSTLNAEGTTIIMVTHSAHDAAYSHRTIHLLDGRVLAEDSRKEVIA